MPNTQHNKTYWRSLDELANTPRYRAFLEAEFPAEDDPGRLSRRRWLQLMGASLALAGAGGCRWEKENIVPLAERPEDRVPGKPYQVATAMDLGGSALGLLVTCVDGRPIKIEGNPMHPASLGATNAYAQAAILELYDPDRSQQLVRRSAGQETNPGWEQFEEFAREHFAELKKDGGAGFRVLSEASSSPTLASLRERLLEEFPEAKWHEYEPLPAAEPGPWRAHVDLSQADVIVCLDCDLLGSHPMAVRHARDFAARRDPNGGVMNRLYAIESCLTITGAAADHRLAVQSGEIAAIAAALGATVEARLRGESVDVFRHVTPHVEKFVKALAEDLVAHRSRCVVVAGPGQPDDVHKSVRGINDWLGNAFKTVFYTKAPNAEKPPSGESIASLATAMRDGKGTTLLILGGNPVYDAPADFNFAAALDKVETTIHLSLYRNETSQHCTWHLPQAHFLESWGDSRAYDGTYAVVQPTIEPLYGGRSAIELLAGLLDGGAKPARDLVKEQFEALPRDESAVVEEDADRRWRRALHDGLVADSGWPVVEPGDKANNSSPNLARAKLENGQLELVFTPDAMLYDGRFANNGWLQEAPDPMTRLCWDNAALLSPATAAALGVENEEIVKLKYKGREVEIPALVMPGQADGSVAVALGYGRTAAGHVGGSEADGVPPVGTDVYKLRTSDAMAFGTGLTVEPTGRKVGLACVQDHFAIDLVGLRARGHRVGELIREATLEHYREHPDFAKHAVHHPPLKSPWEEHDYPGRRWAMAIDLSKCTGCGACVVACQAENNVPIVGRERVLQGREMHWLRIDRYFTGEPDDPNAVRAAVQPMFCQQCENAPCEQVCPVGATVHSAEGLNDMVYNRCIGTRYCANNCLWKVRRFNFFNYHKNLGDPANEVAKLKFNPEVTVRSRGVMEKCTYCVQRIQAAKIEARRRNEPIAEGAIQTACQQACPAGAIAFGDLNNPQSAVRKLHKDSRSYVTLAELNDKPRTAYLAKIRNPNPALEGEEKKHTTEHTGGHGKNGR